MSDQEAESARLPKPADRASGTPPPASPPRAPRRGWSGPLALLLALLALAAVAFGGWRLWQLERGGHAGSTALMQLQQRVDALDAARARTQAERAQLQQTMQAQLGAADQDTRNLGAQVSGLAERTRHLEDAVAKLSTSALSARDNMALDETAMLLRMGAERYVLFNDGTGALRAYALAAQTLATVNDPAFAGVRHSIDAERAALAATHPSDRNADLAALAQLRTQMPTLPPRPLDEAPAATAHGFWQRTWQVLSHVVSVSRDDGAPINSRDAHLARQLASLDVAQAQAALLAHDQGAMRAALTRVDNALARDFDTHAPAVQQARATLARVQERDVGPAVKLGAALAELRNLRQVRDSGEAGPAPAPAHATTVAAPAHPGSTGGTHR